MLTYMGHWSIPDVLPFAGPGAHEPHSLAVNSESEHNHHAEHCHGDASSCSDMPYSGSATIVFLGVTLAGLGAKAGSWPQDVSIALPLSGRSANPDVPPPRA